MSGSAEGRPPLSARLVIGALFIKHINNWDDRETILQIQENMYLQYFAGYTSTTDVIFDPSLFVEIRKRMGDTQLNTLNEEIVKLHLSSLKPEAKLQKVSEKGKNTEGGEPIDGANKVAPAQEATLMPISTEPPAQNKPTVVTRQGRMITDATACPQDIAFPTDVNLPNDAREKCLVLK